MTSGTIDKTKPEDTDFYQQRLRAWQPLLTPWYIILTFLIVGVIFIPIGVIVLSTSNGVVEMEQQYSTDSCEANGCPATLKLEIPEDMKSPVYFYYKLTNFYQNHRRYVKSRSDGQLAGTEGASTTLCDPLEHYSGKTLYPCGLVANSFFNDDFSASIQRVDSQGNLSPIQPLTGLEWDDSDIAWQTDRDHKFVDKYKGGVIPDELTRDGPQGTLPYVDDQHLMVWMRTAGLPTFRKLYAKMDMDLHKGDILTIDIVNNFPVSSFSGTKSIIVSTASWLGGKNSFLGYAYIIVGGICLLFAIAFTIKQKTCPRDLGSISFLKFTPRKTE